MEAGPRSGGDALILCKRGARAAISLEKFEEEENNDGGVEEESIATDTLIGSAVSGNRSPNPKKRAIEKLEVSQEVINRKKCSGDVEESVTTDTSIELPTSGNWSPNSKKRRAMDKLEVSQEFVNINKGSTSKEGEEKASEGDPSMEARKVVGIETSDLANIQAKSDHFVERVSPTKRDKQKKNLLIVTPNDFVEKYLRNCLRDNEHIVVEGVNRAEDI